MQPMRWRCEALLGRAMRGQGLASRRARAAKARPFYDKQSEGKASRSFAERGRGSAWSRKGPENHGNGGATSRTAQRGQSYELQVRAKAWLSIDQPGAARA